MASVKTILNGLPVFTHLEEKFLSQLYQLLFLTSQYSATEVNEIVRNMYEHKKSEEELNDLVSNLEASVEFDRDPENDTKERDETICEKAKEWLKYFPEITDKELQLYFKFHRLEEFQINVILAQRNFEKFRSPKDIKEYLDTIVISQDKAKKVLCFGFYLHLIRIGKLKPIIQLDKAADDPTLPDLPKPNLLLLGPTGSGKTLIIKTLCNLFNIPIVKVDCSSLTSSGYVGNNLNDYLKILINTHGIKNAETAVVYFDEFDKVSELLYARPGGSVGGVELQQEFLSLLEDKERVITRTGAETGEKQQVFKIQNLMFIFSGSFAGIEPIIEKRLGERQNVLGFRKNSIPDHEKESILHKVNFEDVIKFGIIPELAGRIGFMGVLDKLSKEEFITIMKNSKGNILSQYNNFFLHHFDKLIIKEEVYELMADEIMKRNIGARALNGVLIELLQDFLFQAPNEFEEEFVVDVDYFKKKFF